MLGRVGVNVTFKPDNDLSVENVITPDLTSILLMYFPVILVGISSLPPLHCDKLLD